MFITMILASCTWAVATALTSYATLAIMAWARSQEVV